MKKKVLSIFLVVAMIAIAAMGTLAYFTDTDDATNVFTIGSVDIELLESTLHRDNDEATDEDIIADAEEYQDYLAEAGEKMVPGRWVNKAPYINNIGNNPAFVRLKVTFADNLFDAFTIELYEEAFEEGAIVMDNGVDNGDGTVTYTFTFTEALDPDTVTYYAPFWRFKILDSADNADLADFAGVENIITVVAEAIQSEGFEGDYEAAFAAFDNQTLPIV